MTNLIEMQRRRFAMGSFFLFIAADNQSAAALEYLYL